MTPSAVKACVILVLLRQLCGARVRVVLVAPCVGHGLGSLSSSSLALKSTSRRSAGSSDPLCGRKPGTRSSALKGKVRQRRQSSEFEDSFVPCTSPSQRVHLVNSLVRPSSSQDTHDMHGDMNSCGSVHGGGVHVNSSGIVL